MVNKIITKNSKKFVVVFLLLIVAIAIAIFFKINEKTFCSVNSDTLVLNSELAGKSKQQIDELISNRWLSQYKSAFVCSRYKLNDYKIESVGTGSLEDEFS